MREAPPRSILLRLYLAASRRAGGVVRRLLERRRRDGKEDPERIGERIGETTVPRPDGQLVWFHAASVGEAASLLELFRRLQQAQPRLTCLVTTVTVTSAHFVAERLPENCIHQFVPVDVLPWVRRFLDHWRPDAAVWTESEIWPAMLCETYDRGIPMLLINARISERSFRRWRMFGSMARSLLARFDRVLAQDDLASEQLKLLGADPSHISVEGSLKEGAAPLPYDERERQRLARALAGRPVWLAASTHSGEEEIVLAAHGRARRALPMLALILAPRHPNRGDALAEMLRGRGLSVAQRSKGEEFGSDTDVYLADTLGERGLWYRIAAVAFIGGSLADVGGHNPFEPALLGCAILHGPHVRNFIDAYRRLAIADAAVLVRSEDELAEALVATMAPDRAAAMAAAAWEVVSEGAAVTDTVIASIEACLDRRA
ncbi:MAG TPA: 3-deoxy-D-manno-octulosonic acid transferase [Amaricoccus sp.]|nr:3-deoxy-D-manno-octulosonic acid transferase [Amaricoccus sp.]